MTKIFRVHDEKGESRFFPDRERALTHAREEHAAGVVGVEVEMITLIEARPAVIACALLEGGYCAEAKTIKVYKRKR